MISNDTVLNTSSLMMFLFLFAWGICFVIFIYKVLGGPKVGRDSFLYFNFIFFKRDTLANISLCFFVLSYLSQALAEYRRGFDDLTLLANLMGGGSFLLFGIYGKYFYCDTIEDENPFFFINIFLRKVDFRFGSLFLW
ncbi:hypothetical protein, partial [Cronobacter condimenti]|uniref:hypothetical protein n=1 Tax=Cronobacter condimenti TaxID=1163710 RepID=UPI000518A5C1